MKKILCTFLTFILILLLCACGTEGGNDLQTGSPDDGVTQTGQDTKTEIDTDTSEHSFTLLTVTDYAGCSIEDGYYYISEEPVELKDGVWGSHIMYMDFATRQEVYLCSNLACSHDNENCTAVLCEDEFVVLSTKIFAWNGKLYLLSKDYDTDGTVVIDLMPDGSIQAETKAAALYEMNLDGGNRKKVYTFTEGLTVEDIVLANNENLFFVTKELETDMDGNASVTTAQNRNLVQLNLSNGNLDTVLSMDGDDGISWDIAGCYDNSLLLECISYEDGDSGSPDMGYEEWKELYNKSETVFETLDVGSGEIREVYRIQNTAVHDSATTNGILYISDNTSREILAINLRNGETRTLASLAQNNIMGIFSDKLVCRSWDLADDYTLYFVDTEDGEISHGTLTNQYNGWALELICETGTDALVIYDYKADENSDGSYSIYQYRYALIAKEDLYAGKNNFRPIEMIGRGR